MHRPLKFSDNPFHLCVDKIAARHIHWTRFRAFPIWKSTIKSNPYPNHALLIPRRKWLAPHHLPDQSGSRHIPRANCPNTAESENPRMTHGNDHTSQHTSCCTLTHTSLAKRILRPQDNNLLGKKSSKLKNEFVNSSPFVLRFYSSAS